MTLGTFARKALRRLGLSRATFRDSASYWQSRYASGGNSGSGSYNHLAQFKADYLNAFVHDHGVASVVEFGCGDGNQLSLATYPDYIGYDVSEKAIEICRSNFASDVTKRFYVLPDGELGQVADLSLSLDVIFHLVEDSVFDRHMQQVLDATTKYAIFYASDKDEPQQVAHVRHRHFTSWISERRPQFRLIEHVPNKYPFDPDAIKETSFSDFFAFERTSA